MDEDTCTDAELNKLFTNQYHLASEECVSLKKSYILHMAANKSFDRIISGTSSGTVHLYDIAAGLSKLKTPKCLDGLSNAITGVRYANSSQESVLVATSESVLMVDLRSDAIVHTFSGESGFETIGDDVRIYFLNLMFQMTVMEHARNRSTVSILTSTTGLYVPVPNKVTRRPIYSFSMCEIKPYSVLILIGTLI